MSTHIIHKANNNFKSLFAVPEKIHQILGVFSQELQANSHAYKSTNIEIKLR